MDRKKSDKHKVRQEKIFQKGKKFFDYLCMSRKWGVTFMVAMSRKWGVSQPWVVTTGTGPLACLSLFPVAELDKVSYD